MSASPNEVTLVGVMKTNGTIRQQDNLIELTVSDNPATDGCLYWNWVVDQSDIIGFDGAARSITFVHDDPGDTKKTKGKIVLAGFDTTDWEKDGSFTIQLKDPVSGVTKRTADVQLSLRALVNGFTIIDGQSYSPATAGTEGVNGAGHAGFTFHVDSADISLAGVTGPSLILDPMGRVQAYSFPGASWNQEGDFIIRVQDGARPNVQWATISGVQLALRQLLGNGVTIIDGQSYQPAVAGTEGVNAAGVNGFVFTAPSADISLAGVGGASLTFDEMCRVKTYSFPGTSWCQEGDFTLCTQDGSAEGTKRPISVVTARPLALRQLVGNGVTIIDGQSHQPAFTGTEGVNAAGVNGFVFTAPSADISLAGVGGASLTFDEMCRVMTYSFPGTSWCQEGDFTIYANDGTRSTSVIDGRTITLRKISHVNFYLFDNQTAVDPTTINGNPSGTSYDWSSSDERVVISNGGGTRVEERITCSGVEAGTDMDFNLIITDGTRPESHIPCTLKARHVKDPINIPYSESSGSEIVEVTGDSVTEWNFVAGVFSSIESALSFNGGVGNTASITWGDDALINDDSGTLTFTIQPNDASAPSCTILVNINITVLTNINNDVDTTKPTVINCIFEIV